MALYNILFLADNSHHTKAVTDHIQAITTSEQINWHVVNPLIVKTLDKIDLSMFDAIGIHYSVKPYNYYYLSKPLRDKLSRFKGLKFQFLQDEYQKVNQVQDYFVDVGIDVLFTLVTPQFIQKAYPDPRLSQLKIIPILTGYVQDYMKQMSAPPISERTIDVSYRARRYDYWLGKLAYEKQYIAEEFVRRTTGRGLHLDISLEESDRVYGDAWFNLLKSSRAVLGVESGASIWDFDGSIEKKTRNYLKVHKNASFDEVYDNLLKEYDNKILYNAISPRIFEAAATKTPMIMFPGEYSHICQPNKHYILLEKDFSNIEEVLSKLTDVDYLEYIAENAYHDLIQSDLYSQHQFSQLIENTLTQLMKRKSQEINASEITRQISVVVKRHRLLNLARCISTETQFILANFVGLLFDSRYTIKNKACTLFKGFKRYIAYLKPRLSA